MAVIILFDNDSGDGCIAVDDNKIGWIHVWHNSMITNVFREIHLNGNHKSKLKFIQCIKYL